jgi:hypothetical protein
MCVGQNIAKMELSKITATIVQNYDIRQFNPEEEVEWRCYFAALIYVRSRQWYIFQ